MPFYGFEVSDLSDVRVCTVEEFEKLLVFFRVDENGVEVLRILHGARDVRGMTDEILPE